MSLGEIIDGHYKELTNKNEDLSEFRLSICKECKLYLNSVGGVCNTKLWLNPATNETSTEPKEGFLNGCGCRLNAKTRNEYNHCPLGKW